MSDDQALREVPRTYPQGVPGWIDLETPDADVVTPFYRGLLGWELTDAMPPEAPGSYLIATSDGKDVGAIATGVAAFTPDAGWSTYIAVDDADAAALSVERAGGTVTRAPEDDPGGRAAACRDPQGVPFRLWQAGRRIGSQAVNLPGGWNFSDLRTDDPEGAAAFYGEVFGWRVADMGPDAGRIVQVPGYGEHLAATSDPGILDRQRAVGAPAGFADAIGAILPVGAGEASHWHVTFSVRDRDAAVATAERLGGSVATTADGRWSFRADVRDPAGNACSVSQFRFGG